MEKQTMGTDEEEKMNDLLIAKIDEITGGEMKKVGIQKMENELTIKKLDREYLEIKRNLIFSKKMLDEARKNGSTQSETKDQLLLANKAIIEKFNELKKYQNEITLINISKGENTLQDCIDRNNECRRMLHIILDKNNYYNFLNQNLLDKKNQLNEDIQRQIKQKIESVNSSGGALIGLTKKVESQKAQIDEEKFDNRIKLAVEERNKRMIQLQADCEVLNKQFKQEIDDLQQKKLHKILNLENHQNDIETSQSRLHDLQSQLSETEKQLITQNGDLENIKMKIEDISHEIQRKIEANNQSKGSFENDFTSLHNEIIEVDCELQKEKMAFNETENDMQNEMEKLFTELEQKKKLQNALENRQYDLSKAKEKRLEQQKLLSQNRELNNKLTNLTEEYNKQNAIGSINTNKQIELNNKIKDLREKRDNSRKQLENLSKSQIRTSKVVSCAKDNVAKSSADNIKQLSQQINTQKKLYDVYDNCERETNLSSSETSKKTSQHSMNCNESYTFNLDSSDESEDEYKIIDKTPRKQPVSIGTPIYKNQDYACGFIDKHHEDSANERLSQSERLFDELVSSENPTESTMNKKDEDIFKIPSTYAPMKKRGTQFKKY